MCGIIWLGLDNFRNFLFYRLHEENLLLSAINLTRFQQVYQGSFDLIEGREYLGKLNQYIGGREGLLLLSFADTCF